MVNNRQRHILSRCLGVSLMAAALIASSCNAKEEPGTTANLNVPSVAVTKFSIKPNAAVMTDLDSVYFSIDLDHGVIFNADSLPLGTKINKLVPLITYPSTVSKAEIIMTGGDTRTGTVNYLAAPTDSIDFTGDVKLVLTAEDGELTKTYTLKVNVHKCVSDSLVWDQEAVSALPARYASPKEQKTVDVAGKTTVSIIRESNDQLTLATCGNPADCDWTRSALTLPFIPQLRSLTSCGESLYMLADDGALYSSADNGATWSATSTRWSGIIGEFNGALFGLTADATPMIDLWPRPAGYTPAAVPADFPTADYSNFNTFTTKWSTSPIGFFAGGSRDGRALPYTWAYDGENWAKISNNNLPALKNPVIVPYFCYRKTNTSWIQTEYSVWLCMGGLLADNTVNPTLYITFDNGVNWHPASELMQYPDFIRPGYSADAVVRSTPMSADLDAQWKSVTRAMRRTPQMRISYFVDGSDVNWECPYIYLFGGHDSAGTLNDEIRRAVLARLMFTPIF
ncbi:MAG: hypothetical protein K2L83_07935 [Muribaculaceae bacterium]|nr:hypothetical protein [Muribaculaceae bacterium]